MIDLLQASRRSKLLILGCMAAAGIALCQLTVPLVIGWLLDEMARDSVPTRLARLCIVLAMLALVTVLFQTVHRQLFAALEERSLQELQRRLISSVWGRAPEESAQVSTGLFSSLLGTDSAKVATLQGRVLGEVTLGSVQLIGLLVLLSVKYGKTSYWALVLTPIYLVLPLLLHRKGKSISGDLLQARTAVEELSFDSFRGRDEIRVFDAERWVMDKLGESMANRWQARFKQVTFGALQWSNYVLASLVGACVYYLGGLKVIEGTLTVGALVTLVALLGYLESPINRLAKIGFQYQAIAAARSRLREHLDSPLKRRSERSVSDRSAGVEIRAMDLGFRYPDGSVALKKMSFRQPGGTILGVVGHSGSGKSSLVKLIAGLYSPTDGALLLDGKESRLVPVGLVPQDTFLLPTTLRENIRMGRSFIREIDIEEALVAAGAAEFAFRQPRGLDTELGEAGLGLSGGQKQRIAIARALAGRPGLLVLDEATASLDLALEQHLVEHLARLRGDATVVWVNHRVSSLKIADQILLLQEGRLIGKGSYDELFDSSNQFQGMVAAD